MDSKSNKSWLGAAFGMLFLFAGFAAAYGSAGHMIVGYILSSDWVEVPADIHIVTLERGSGDSTTYSVRSQYSYQYNGSDYHSSRVSLSAGKDNISRYWQDLERTLRDRQFSKEAFAYVNPDNPSESLLDRTLRWQAVVFGFVFLSVFGGVGGFITWASLVGTKSRKARLRIERSEGIYSDQKTGRWFFLAFGGLMFVFSTGLSAIALPDAIREGNYAALLMLLFVFISLAIVYRAIKIHHTYRRFGPTPLRLDPAVPGVGGQLGGRFSINVDGIGIIASSTESPTVTLTCKRKRKSGKHTNTKVIWEEDVPIHLKQTAKGIDASFLFELPDTCKPSVAWRSGSSIEWSVSVDTEFANTHLGKFEREWSIVVEDKPSRASDTLSIPQTLVVKAKQEKQERVKSSALDRVPVFEDTRYIKLLSRAGRDKGAHFFMILFGLVFAGAGVLTVTQNWWPGYLFILVGSVVLVASVHSLGKSINVEIDKEHRMLNAQVSWFGFAYANQKGAVLRAEQFNIKLTSSTTSGSNTTEYYAVNFKSDGKIITIADKIEGEKQALSLKQMIIDGCFVQQPLPMAA